MLNLFCFWFLTFYFYLGFEIHYTKVALVDRRFFYRSPYSSSMETAKWLPLYPAILDFAQDYLTLEDRQITSRLLKPFTEVQAMNISEAERGHILQRAVFAALHWRYSREHSDVRLRLETGLRLHRDAHPVVDLFCFTNRKPVFIEYSGIFPDIQDFGIYWSTKHNYPLVEGFIYNCGMLIGIQITVSRPSKHSSSKIGLPSDERPYVKPPGARIQVLLHRVLEFCRQNNAGFSMVYILPPNIFKEIADSKKVHFNILDAKSILVPPRPTRSS